MGGYKGTVLLLNIRARDVVVHTSLFSKKNITISLLLSNFPPSAGRIRRTPAAALGARPVRSSLPQLPPVAQIWRPLGARRGGRSDFGVAAARH